MTWGNSWCSQSCSATGLNGIFSNNLDLKKVRKEPLEYFFASNSGSFLFHYSLFFVSLFCYDFLAVSSPVYFPSLPVYYIQAEICFICFKSLLHYFLCTSQPHCSRRFTCSSHIGGNCHTNTS